MKNKLLIVSGPSGVGKGTMVSELAKRRTDVAVSVSCTTREPRPNEKDGRDYHFITREEFMKRVEEDGFLEYNAHFKNCYGTPKPFVVENLKTKHVLLEIEVDGALKVKQAMPDCVMVMVLPPSVEELRKRLIERNTESREKIEERLARLDYEISKKDEYQYVIINDVLDEAVDELSAILDME